MARFPFTGGYVCFFTQTLGMNKANIIAQKITHMLTAFVLFADCDSDNI
jgi:hypothetical protein